jgi:glycosyltransferase involved in cell wall biosynthesis
MSSFTGDPFLNITVLVESVDHVCCRYRVTAFRSRLASLGLHLSIVSLPRSLWSRLKVLRSVRAADAVVIQRRLLSLPELALLRRSAKRIIFDFDDAVWLRDSYSAKGFESRKRGRRFRAMMQSCDAVFAGNSYLADEARAFTPSGAVHIVPTCVDPARYAMARHDDCGPVRLVWVGSSSTLQGLERFREVLERIGREVPGVRLKLVCDRFLTLQQLPVECVSWSESTEAAEIASADIGFGWVPDDPWSRGKCGLKILQYQAAGLPVIANPVGVQGMFVRDGETGIQATTPAEWVDAVRKLAADPALRRRLGEAGRRQVEQHYSVEAGARLWQSALYGIQGEPEQFEAVKSDASNLATPVEDRTWDC